MPKDEFLEKLNSSFCVIVENHVVVKINVRRSIRPDLNARIIGVGSCLKVRALFDRGNFYSYARYWENSAPDEVCQVWLKVKRHGTPLVEDEEEARWLYCFYDICKCFARTSEMYPVSC